MGVGKRGIFPPSFHPTMIFDGQGYALGSSCPPQDALSNLRWPRCTLDFDEFKVMGGQIVILCENHSLKSSLPSPLEFYSFFFSLEFILKL